MTIFLPCYDLIGRPSLLRSKRGEMVVLEDVRDFLTQDGNGFINRMELRHVMMNLGEKMTEDECDCLVDVRTHSHPDILLI